MRQMLLTMAQAPQERVNTSENVKIICQPCSHEFSCRIAGVQSGRAAVLWGCGALGLWGCGVVGVGLWCCWGFGAVGLWGCGAVGLWGCGDVGLWGCGAVGLLGCKAVALFSEKQFDSHGICLAKKHPKAPICIPCVCICVYVCVCEREREAEQY